MQCEERDCKAREVYLITRDNTLQPSDLNKMTKCNILIMSLYLTIILRGRAGYLSNRPQVSMVYRLLYNNKINGINWDVGRTLEEFVNHSPVARDLQILLVFY